MKFLDVALVDDEGDREEESGRAKAEADDEPGGAAFDVVLAALVSFCFRRDAVDDERVRAVTTLQKNHQRRDHGDGFRMDAGDADFEVVPVAFLDGERVVAFAALRVREASTRASSSARGRKPTAAAIPDGRGSADVEFVVVAVLDGEHVLVFATLRVRKASTRVMGSGARRREATAAAITDGRGRR